jgi:hypothetical protein
MKNIQTYGGLFGGDPFGYRLVEARPEPLGYGLTMIHHEYDVIDLQTEQVVDHYSVPAYLDSQ